MQEKNIAGMKKISFILLIGISISLLSCHKGGEKTEKVDVRTYQLSEKSQTGEYAMQQSSAKGEAKIGGVEYQYEIDRNPSPQLPKVKDEQNNLFVDNVIDLRIIRNGKSILSKRFTKKDFSSHVDPAFAAKSILEGLVFDQTVNGKLRFAASVCVPQTDLYVPLCVWVSTDGKVYIEKGNVLEEEIPGRNN